MPLTSDEVEKIDAAAEKIGEYLGLELRALPDQRRSDREYSVVSPTGRELITITLGVHHNKVYYGGIGWIFAHRNQENVQRLLRGEDIKTVSVDH